MKKLLLVLFFIPAISFSQTKKQRKALEAQQKADLAIVSDLKTHTATLTSDISINLYTAAEYISAYFKNAGLQPKDVNGYLQQFTIEDGKQVDNTTSLKMNGTALELNKEYFPLAYSASKSVSGMPAMALRERGVPWFKDVKEWFNENTINAAFTIDQAIQKEAAAVAAKGATALFIYNSTGTADGVYYNRKDKTAAMPIPVIYIMPQGYKKYFNDDAQMLDIELNVAFKESIRNCFNVAGYLDNNASSSVIITSAVDTKSKTPDVSGAATLLEVAKMVSAAKSKNNNFLFSITLGENIAEAGSKFLLNSVSLPAEINYSINIGNVSAFDANKRLVVNGAQTSSSWNDMVTSVANDQANVDLMLGEIKGGSIGLFYDRSIPVLSLSTVANNVTVSDTTTYLSELQTVKFAGRLIEAADTKGKLVFAKVADDAVMPVAVVQSTDQPTVAEKRVASSSPAKNSVSLGVIPDKVNDGTGLKISGVSAKKSAAKLGLQPGDVLVYLGNYKITDLNTYLSALSNYKPGDKTVVGIKRGKEDKEFAVEF